jgi:hypothetical protein
MPVPHIWHEFFRYIAPFQHLFYFAFGGVAIALRRYWQTIRETVPRDGQAPMEWSRPQPWARRTAVGSRRSIATTPCRSTDTANTGVTSGRKRRPRSSPTPFAASACRSAIAKTTRMSGENCANFLMAPFINLNQSALCLFICFAGDLHANPRCLRPGHSSCGVLVFHHRTDS